MQSIYTVLVRPVVTEKSMQAQGSGKYTFVVNQDATKVDIQNSVEKMYNTEVESVNIVPVRKKERVVGRGKYITKRQASKRAIVTLKKGKTIDVMKLNEDKTEKKTTKKETAAK